MKGVQYCSMCTDMASYATNTVSYSTDTVSYGSSGKKGLPELCSVLPPASSVCLLFAVLQPGPFSVYCLIDCTTTRVTFS